jgi:RHS repeat-associated protein
MFAADTSTGVTVSSLSGGGVTTWTKATGFTGSPGFDQELWYGKVTTPGASIITPTWSGSIAGREVEYATQEFSSASGSSTTWAVDHSGTQDNPTSSTTITYPSLSPTGSGELYFGFALDLADTGGSTTGFTYASTNDSNQVTYDTNVSSPSAYQPTGTQTPASNSSAVAAVLTATGTGGGSCTSGSASGSGPIVNGVSPCTGSTAGGTTVVITGLNFTGASAVKFGSTPAASFSVTSSTSITAVAPAGATGPVDVTVTTSGALGLQELAAYSAYGVQTIQSGADVTPFGFQGSYTDPSGLTYLIGRYYDPTTDQFLSVDPDLAETGQPHAFTGDDPLNRTDPLGLTAGPHPPPKSACAHQSHKKNCEAKVKKQESCGRLSCADVRNAHKALPVAIGVTLFLATGGIGDAIGGLAATGDAADTAVTSTSTSTLERVGSGLKEDTFHRATSWVVDDPEAVGTDLVNGDGSTVTSYSLPGGVNGLSGIFNWIIDANGDEPVVTHQFFTPDS